MTDIAVQIDNLHFDEKDEASDKNVPSTPLSKDEEVDAWKLLSDKDPVTGLSYDWLEIRRVLMEEGVAKALPLMMDYYVEQSKGKFDPYMCYMLATSHFTKEELELPSTRAARRSLELKIRKLLKKEKKTQPTRQFLYEHGAELLKKD